MIDSVNLVRCHSVLLLLDIVQLKMNIECLKDAK